MLLQVGVLQSYLLRFGITGPSWRPQSHPGSVRLEARLLRTGRLRPVDEHLDGVVPPKNRRPREKRRKTTP